MKHRFHTLLWFSAISLTLFCILLYALRGHWFSVSGSIVLVYLTKPLHRKLRIMGFSSATSAFILSLTMFSVIFILVFCCVPKILVELARLIKQLPGNIDTTVSLLNQHLSSYDITLETHNIPKIIGQVITKQDISTLQTLPKVIFSTLGQFIDIILFLTSILFIPIFFFFAIQHSDHFMMSMLSLVPPAIRNDISDFILILNETFSTWIVGQGGLILTLITLYSFGFLLLQVPYAIVLGILTGVLYIIPAVGALITLVLSIVIAIANFGIDFSLIAQIVGLYAILQTFEAFVLSPYLIGNKLGLNLSMSLLSILVGGGLFGGVGIVLAVPIASAIKKTVKLIQDKISEDWIYD